MSENWLKLVKKTNFWDFPVISDGVSYFLMRARDRLQRTYKQTTIGEQSPSKR